jgi:hypothetical protein
MIPREILKIMRQIEIRTNRIVTGSAAGARLCEPQHSRLAWGREISERVRTCEAAAGLRPALRSGARASARFNVPKPGATETSPAPCAVHALKPRERRAPAASERGIQLVFSPALTCALSTRRGFQPFTFPASPTGLLSNPTAILTKESASISPSPWREGQDEGGRNTNFRQPAIRVARSAFRVPHSAFL